MPPSVVARYSLSLRLLVHPPSRAKSSSSCRTASVATSKCPATQIPRIFTPRHGAYPSSSCRRRFSRWLCYPTFVPSRINHIKRSPNVGCILQRYFGVKKPPPPFSLPPLPPPLPTRRSPNGGPRSNEPRRQPEERERRKRAAHRALSPRELTGRPTAPPKYPRLGSMQAFSKEKLITCQLTYHRVVSRSLSPGLSTINNKPVACVWGTAVLTSSRRDKAWCPGEDFHNK